MTRTRPTKPVNTQGEEPLPHEADPCTSRLEGDSFCVESKMVLQCDSRVVTNVIIQRCDVSVPRMVWPEQPSQDEVHVSG